MTIRAQSKTRRAPFGLAAAFGLTVLATASLTMAPAARPPVCPPAAPPAQPELPPVWPASAPSPARNGARAAVAYYATRALGIPVHVVQADLNSPYLRISVATARGGIGHRELWSSMIGRTRPTAAITGTYFGLESAVPVGSIVVRGIPVHQTLTGSALAFRAPADGASPGEARMITLRRGQRFNWRPYETVLRAGPRLLAKGLIVVSPRDEGFRDPGLRGRRMRSVVGITRQNKLLLVGARHPVTLWEAAKIMRALGARDAMCLDGGTSTGLFYRGKTHLKPRRALTNLLVLYDSPSAYERAATRLTPHLTPTIAGRGNGGA